MINHSALLDFDDILIVPKTKTSIESRYSGISLPSKLPLFTAPMDTVVDLNNMEVFEKNKINVVLPRTINYTQYINHRAFKTTSNVFISMGFDDLNSFEEKEFNILPNNPYILIDVANGHMEKIVKYAKTIKKQKPNAIIMVGNIANPETYKWYFESNCVDYIRLGIGNGNGCLTTKQSGIGYPMASLIHNTYKIKKDLMKKEPNINPPKIVADGGMKNYSDIVKALALGADYVMLGSIFNKALESCCNNYLYNIKINKNTAKRLFHLGFPVKKYFRGMSTKEAQKAMGKSNLKTSEGVVRYRKIEYLLNTWVENFEHYLRNAMSYSNAKTLDDFIGKAEISIITENAYKRFNK